MIKRFGDHGDKKEAEGMAKRKAFSHRVEMKFCFGRDSGELGHVGMAARAAFSNGSLGQDKQRCSFLERAAGGGRRGL